MKQPSYASHKRNDFCKSLGSDIVVIKIGKAKEPFTFHKARLCSVSDFFKKAFTGSFREGREQEMHIEDVEIHVFESFQEWFYHDTITFQGMTKTHLDLLVNVYLFADRILCNGLKNSAMDHLQDAMYQVGHTCYCCSHLYLSTSNVRKIFENTVANGSPIRKYCAAIVYHATDKGWEKVAGYFKVKGFESEFSDYQCGLKDADLDSDEGEKQPPAELDDPRIRGYRYILDSTGKRVKRGYSICFFHVHGAGDLCTSKINFASPGEDDYGDDSDGDICNGNMQLEQSLID